MLGESMTPPPPTLDGTWEGREAPFTAKGTSPWWRFDVEHDGSSGTFVTDRSSAARCRAETESTDCSAARSTVPAESTGRRCTSSTSVPACRDARRRSFSSRYNRPRSYRALSVSRAEWTTSTTVTLLVDSSTK